MKKLMLAVVACMLMSVSAFAEAGCGLDLTLNSKITARYGVWVTIVPKDPNNPSFTVPPGEPLIWPLNNGDTVEVAVAQNVTPCGSVGSINWGYTTFFQCSVQGAAQQLSLPGTFINDTYTAYVECLCPALDGLGWLAENKVGQQCASNPPPQQ